MKHLYDFLKTENALSSNALPELLVKNFDVEQIWQQIELQNEIILKDSVKDVGRLLVNKNKLRFNNISTLIKEQTDKVENQSNNEDIDESNNEEDIDESNNEEDINESINEEDINGTKIGKQKRKQTEESDEGSSEEPVKKRNNLEQYSSDEDSDEEQIDLDNENAEAEKNFISRKSRNRKSVVDDDFFKLDEMETFLEREEKKLDNPEQNNKLEESETESDASVDLFKDYSNNDEDDEEMKVKTAKFKDFFRADINKELKRNKFLEDISDDEENDIKSTLELRQERLNKKMEEIEEYAVGEKPWTLKGEITGDSRPQNSLLEEIVEFDISSRPGKKENILL